MRKGKAFRGVHPPPVKGAVPFFGHFQFFIGPLHEDPASSSTFSISSTFALGQCHIRRNGSTTVERQLPCRQEVHGQVFLSAVRNRELPKKTSHACKVLVVFLSNDSCILLVHHKQIPARYVPCLGQSESSWI